MSYADDARAALLRHLPRELDERLVDLYTLLVLRLGARTEREDVHDAWAVWQTRTDPDHGSARPLHELDAEVQALDDPYVEAIRAAAADLRRDATSG